MHRSLSRRRLAVVTVFSAVLLLGTLVLAAPRVFAGSTDWRSGLLSWRAAQAQQLSAPDGWLTLVGLDWIEPGDNSFGAAADNRIQLSGATAPHLGVLQLSRNAVRLLPPQGGFPAALRIDGHSARPTLLSGNDMKPHALTDGSLTFYVIHRGDRYALRVKDADAPTRIHFRGLHWYAPNPRYRIEARWIPWLPAHVQKIPTVIGTTIEMPAPGLAEFTLDGKTVRLEPVLEEPGARQLFFIVRDATSHSTTYGAGRFLYTNLPDHGLQKPGHLVLDFNRLENPPCAYTPYATCPLPPQQNRLAIALPAGEQRYSH
ncbi:MAG TPA: DUF1684 domain-containing protein [Acidobacteriaceae bacterium]|jgi:hypothetical protein|nr:DUF1684 domain-containing protein [Acidobacteriaceae bacterium]